jgi:uncharacterized protein (TIGR00251 family)
MKPDELPWIMEKKGDLIIRVHVQPGARANRICGLHGNRLKLKIQAPPVDGAANRACQKILSKTFKVSKSSVILESGASSRQKVFRIVGKGVEAARQLTSV